jgi:hypothetical protein
MVLLKKSYLFAKRFNGDKDLRMRLWREGFMKQQPNLLKQESGSCNLREHPGAYVSRRGRRAEESRQRQSRLIP